MELTKWTLSPQWSISLFLLLLPALISMQMRQNKKGELGLEQKSHICRLPICAGTGDFLTMLSPPCSWRKFLKWGGQIMAAHSLHPSRRLSYPPVDFCLCPYYFIPPAALCSYMSLFLSFCFHPPILSWTHTKTISAAQHLLSYCGLCCEVAGCYIRVESASLSVSQIKHKGNERQHKTELGEASLPIQYQLSLRGIYENLWTLSYCQPRTVIRIICYYQHFSCHWFDSFFITKVKLLHTHLFSSFLSMLRLLSFFVPHQVVWLGL